MRPSGMLGVQFRMAPLFDASAVRRRVPCGSGGAVGVAVAMLDGPPGPIAFIAETRNSYSVPLANPVTVAEVSGEAVWLNGDQFVPPSLEYSIK